MFNPSVYEQRDYGGYRREANYEQSSFLVLDFDNGSLSPDAFIEAFGKNASLLDRLSFVICNTFSRCYEQPNRFRVIVFFKKPAATVAQHKASFDFIEAKLRHAGWCIDQCKVDRAGRSPVQSFYMPCTNRNHQDYSFFEAHNSRAREIAQYGLDPEELAVLLDEHSGTNWAGVIDAIAAVDEFEFPQALIDQATAEVEILPDGRNKLFFRVAVQLAKLRHQGKRLSTDAIERILMQTKGSEQKDRRRKVNSHMRSLRRYGLI